MTDTHPVTWRKSSQCSGDGENCVEIASVRGGSGGGVHTGGTHRGGEGGPVLHGGEGGPVRR